MPDIVNAGAIVIIGLFTLVAVIGAADQLAPDADSESSLAGPRDGAPASQDGPSGPDLLDVEETVPAKHGGDDVRPAKHHDRDGERGEDDDRRDGKDHDKDDDEGDAEEDEDKDDREDKEEDDD